MTLKSVYESLCLLENLKSTNAKKKELEGMFQDPLFVKVCQYALDPRKKYKVKKMLPFQYQSPMVKSSVDDIFQCLDVLADQKGASKKDKERLSYVSSMDTETWEVVHRICNGDLKCGCGVRTINSVYQDLIPFTPYLRCSSNKKLKNIRFPAILQEKANGMYAEMIVDGDKIKFGSRDSHEIHQLDHLKTILLNGMREYDPEQCVYMGELRIFNINKHPMGRQEANGIINKCTQNTASRAEACAVFFTVWDKVPLNDYNDCLYTAHYLDRFKEVCEDMDCIGSSMFEFIDYQMVDNLEQAQSIANHLIASGEEGAIIKNTDAIWKHGTSKDQVKMKRRFDCDLRVLDWEFGDEGKRNADRMGRIIVGTDDGQVKCAVGMGFSDALREEDWDKHIGRICEIEYEEATKSKSRKDDIWSLSGPAGFVRFRDNKDKTDTVEYILEG